MKITMNELRKLIKNEANLYPGFGPRIKMELDGVPESFWILEKKYKNKVMANDIYEVNFASLMRQVMGGFEPEQIYGIYDTEEKAIAAKEKINNQ